MKIQIFRNFKTGNITLLVSNITMAPTIMETSTILLQEATRAAVTAKAAYTQPEIKTQLSKTVKTDHNQYKWQIVWRNVIFFIYLHYAALYGLYFIFGQAQLKSVLFVLFSAGLGGHGITMGAHRLWAHKSYKAKLPLRILLCFCQTLAFQNHIYEWVRDHRAHHKFTDTDADPHNAKRGFFFSHMGWLMIKKHQDVKTIGNKVEMSDLEEDGVVMFQKKYYLILMPLCTFVLPTLLPWYFWGENLMTAWYLCMFRYCYSLHATWLVNSAAHIYGMRPYDKNISSTESKFVSMCALGEGWHNYHHCFPWDYKAAELGFHKYNITTGTIDLCSSMGLAYDLKTASEEIITKRSLRTGDGSRISKETCHNPKDINHNHHNQETLWGWGDKDMNKEDIQLVRQHNRLTCD